MDVFDELHMEGNTIILVTHEAYIAKHAHRTIHLLDGRIEKDDHNRKTKKRKKPTKKKATA